MAGAIHQSSIWRLATAQHGGVTRAQLLERGLSAKGIEHRLATPRPPPLPPGGYPPGGPGGTPPRLPPLRRGVYAVGRREVTRLGEWMAAVLCCGPAALLSHASAAALVRIRPDRPGPIEVSAPLPLPRSPPGLVVHRRTKLAA